MEAAYAGTSFLTPRTRAASATARRLLNVAADATTPGGLGTFGCDDEGVAGRRHTDRRATACSTAS